MMSDDIGLKFCTNCKRDIPEANYVMHSMHCQRNLFLCTKCDEPIPLVELKSHNTKYHVSVECPDCKINVEKMKLTEHKLTACKHRVICCSFCHIETDANELQEHENYCGSRTEKCADCGEYIMLKYTQLHLDSNHGFIKLDMWPDSELGSTSTRNKSPKGSTGLLNDLSRTRKVPNASQTPVRSLMSSNASAGADLLSRPTASQNAKPAVNARLPRWNESDNVGLPSSRHDYLQGNPLHTFPDRVLPSRTVPDAVRDNSFRNAPDLVRGGSSRKVQDPVRAGSSWKASQEPVLPYSSRSVHESVRPSTAGNRQSPSKRTNDMPQVNSATTVDIQKALHKPVIKKNESERLIAAIAKPDQGRNPFALANHMMENLDLHDLGSGDIVALPCEFCEAMIPANQLVIHETGCRPDLACFKSQVQSDVLGDNGLPCEFCGGLYPPHNLLAHQAHCEATSTRGGGVLVNELDVSKLRPKLSNLAEGERLRWQAPHSFRESDEVEEQAAAADTNPLGGQRQLSAQSASAGGALNGHQRQLMSTGAVPKQKAGTRPSLREVQQEVSRPSSAPSMTPRNYMSR